MNKINKLFVFYFLTSLIQITISTIIKDEFRVLNATNPLSGYNVKEIKVFDKVKQCTKDIFVEFFNKYLNSPSLGFLSNDRTISILPSDQIPCQAEEKEFLKSDNLKISTKGQEVLAIDYDDYLSLTTQATLLSKIENLADFSDSHGDVAKKTLLKFFDDYVDLVFWLIILFLICLLIFLQRNSIVNCCRNVNKKRKVRQINLHIEKQIALEEARDKLKNQGPNIQPLPNSNQLISIQPANIQPANIQPANIQPTNIQPTNIQSSVHALYPDPNEIFHHKMPTIHVNPFSIQNKATAPNENPPPYSKNVSERVYCKCNTKCSTLKSCPCLANRFPCHTLCHAGYNSICENKIN